jgi:DNA-directed RNA polymerase I, II, and III subunit RPABC1
MEAQQREISRLWRVYKTVHEMVRDRGYLVAKSELEMGLDEFKQTYTTAGAIEYTFT